MATFSRAVVGVPAVAAIVLSFQHGVYLDVQHRFVEFTQNVKYQAAQGMYSGAYIIPGGFSHNTTIGSAYGLDESTRRLTQEELGLSGYCDRDPRFPLHLAIYEGNLALTLRIIACRPDLAFMDAIETAFVCQQYDIAHALMDLRASVPQLTMRYQDQDVGNPAAIIRGATVPCVTNRGNLELLTLLREFRPSKWPTRAFESALYAHARANATFLYTHCPETHFDGMLDAAAHAGIVDLVHQMHANGDICTTFAMDSAAANGHLEIVEFLHSHRTEGCTTDAMESAAANGHLEIVEFLHTHRTEGCTASAITKAAAAGHVAVVTYLVLHRHEGDISEALKQAVAHGQVNVVKFLLPFATTLDCHPSLDDAAANGHLGMVEYLHSLGAAVHCSKSAATMAAAYGYEDVVRFLMQHRSEGASPNAAHRALEGGHFVIAKYLVEENGFAIQVGSPLNLRWHRFDATTSLPEVVELLSCHGVTWQTSWMDEACSKSDVMLVQALHAHSTAGCTTAAMDNAAREGNLDILSFLATHRTERCTVRAFHEAASHESPEVLLCLWHNYPHVFYESVYSSVTQDHMLHVMLDHKMGDPRHILLFLTPNSWHNERLFAIGLSRCFDPATPLENLLALATLHKHLMVAIPRSKARPSMATMAEEAIMDQVHAWGQSHLSKDPSEWTELDVAASSVLATKDLSSWINIVVFQHYFVQDAAGYEPELCDAVGNIEPKQIKRDCLATMQGHSLGLLLAWPKEGNKPRSEVVDGMDGLFDVSDY
ncbi:Aste57867_22855 [Aphanomyces stellatus]|uniref:Aste57867_22855 protein n=1 Tax=Aphanomyces stellatus TaxID=120398 RepID=A0A485LMR8_9STRA|nr:hypothetical protein As57867_022784 [Aphanomyces stellatus]VFT99505.1 Aste57867_22855 [Aphanomyces stellatus]